MRQLRLPVEDFPVEAGTQGPQTHQMTAAAAATAATLKGRPIRTNFGIGTAAFLREL